MTMPTDSNLKNKEAGQAFLDENSINKGFSSQEVLNAIRLLILSDPEILDNSMRYSIPDRQFAVAAASYIRKCEAHGYTDGVKQVKMQLGLMTSIRGQRVDKLVAAIIGEREFASEKPKNAAGILDKIKGMYKD